MKVKCISNRLNHVHFATQGDGTKKAVRITVGDVFEISSVPAMWTGLVVPVETETKKAVTNPAKSQAADDTKSA
jgi:hypothetical protein